MKRAAGGSAKSGATGKQGSEAADPGDVRTETSAQANTRSASGASTVFRSAATTLAGLFGRVAASVAVNVAGKLIAAAVTPFVSAALGLPTGTSTEKSASSSKSSKVSGKTSKKGPALFDPTFLDEWIDSGEDQMRLFDAMTIRLGGLEPARALWETVREQSVRTGTSAEQLGEAALTLLPYAPNLDQMQGWLELSQRLTALAPGKEVGEAADAIRQALEGSTEALVGQFGLSERAIAAAGLDAAVKSGDAGAVFQSLDRALADQGMSAQAFEQMLETPSQKLEMFRNNLDQLQADAGMRLVSALTPLLDALNRLLADSTIWQPVMDGLSAGFSIAAQAAAWLVDLVHGLLGKLMAIPDVAQTIGALVAGFVMLAGALRVVTFLQSLWNMLALNNPFMLIVRIVFILIGALLMLASTMEPVRKIVTSIIEWIAEKVFAVIRGLISGISRILKFLGISFDSFSGVDNRLTGPKSFDNPLARSLSDQAALPSGQPMFQNRQSEPPQPTVPPVVRRVDEVGAVRDTVDISSEDLKMMRELAEIQAIQNFVTLTPTVQVTTGPISRDVDVDAVVARIEEALTEQIASSARGVYGFE